MNPEPNLDDKSQISAPPVLTGPISPTPSDSAVDERPIVGEMSKIRVDSKLRPRVDWVRLKIDYMASEIYEVRQYLESKGIEADEYAYKCTRGWRRDKMENVKKALYVAEQKAFNANVERMEEKIRRRSTWWKTIQQAIVRKLLTTDSEGKQVYRESIGSEELFFLTKAYDIAVKGERLEDGQPTIVEKIDQVNTHTFSFEELAQESFKALEDEMAKATKTHDDSAKNPIPDSNQGGGDDQGVPSAVLPKP